MLTWAYIFFKILFSTEIMDKITLYKPLIESNYRFSQIKDLNVGDQTMEGKYL